MAEVKTAPEPPTQSDTLRFADWLSGPESAIQSPIEVSHDANQQWAISFDILMGGWVTGTDKGILWFDRQNMYVLGQLTSFAIPGHRLGSKVEKRHDVYRPLQRAFHVPVTGASGLPLSIQLDVITSEPYVPENLAFLEALRNCSATSDPEREGQLPPVTVHVSAHSIASLRRKMGGQLCRLAVVIGASAIGIGLIMEEIRLNLFLGAIIFIGATLSCVQWNWPKLSALTQAIRSCVNHSKPSR